jgi:hypothetical protein
MTVEDRSWASAHASETDSSEGSTIISSPLLRLLTTRHIYSFIEAGQLMGVVRLYNSIFEAQLLYIYALRSTEATMQSCLIQAGPNLSDIFSPVWYFRRPNCYRGPMHRHFTTIVDLDISAVDGICEGLVGPVTLLTFLLCDVAECVVPLPHLIFG